MNTWTLGAGVRLPLAVGFFVAAFLIAAASPAWAGAATITVNSTANTEANDGVCTFREAIASANNDTASGAMTNECAAGSGRDDIVFDLPGGPNTIATGGTQFQITSNLTITGPGADLLTMNGSGPDRVFEITSGNTVEISGMSIINGSAVSGGGILNSGNLKLAESVVSGNAADDGGGIYNADTGTMTLTESAVSDNETGSFGGGIFNGGTMTVSRSTVSGGNTAFFGGGIYSETEGIANGNSPEERITITNSTISGNIAERRGGGVRNGIGLTVIKNSTITKNTAPAGEGSGVASSDDAEDRTEVSSSIIAANTNTDVDFGDEINTFLSNGHNLIGDGNTAAFTAAKRDRVIGNASPGLGNLAENGGPTMTHEVEEDSGAIDGGDSGTLTTDQRGEDRTSDFPAVANAKDGTGDGTDIGAYERQFVAPPPPPNPLGCTIFGTSGNDNNLRGTPGRDVICGFGGNDTIRSLAGNDVIYGGPGNDLVYGEAGNDRILGEGGNDTLLGGPGNDVILGGAGNDLLRGGSGNDLINGGPGRDRLFGEAGNDALFGGPGNDTLVGGPGRDRLVGGPGRNILRQ